MKSIYDLKLHEQTESGRYLILRVPGGWIYTSRNLNAGCTDSDVFVPFDNEFMDPSQKDTLKEMTENYVNDIINLNEVTEFPPIEKSSKNGFIKHVQCAGARFHVVHWDTLGSHCSEKKCILNEKYSHKNKKE
jgi:hypothetical protein